MKKTIITLAIFTSLSSVKAHARPEVFIKVEGGAQHLNNFSVFYEENNSSLKAKSKIGAFGGIGIGANLTHITRADITFSYYGMPTWKGKEVDVNTGQPLFRGTLKIKKMMGTMVNGALDLYDTGTIKLFAGGGIGGTYFAKEKSENNTSKSSIKFSYALTAGLSTQISDKATLEIAYRWQDYGKLNIIGVRGHHAVGGIRFNL